MNREERIEKLITSLEFSLNQLDKVLNQNIDLAELDPEKAKQAVQGKTEAMNASITIIDKLDELKKKLNPEEDESDSKKVKRKNARPSGPEGRIVQ